MSSDSPAAILFDDLGNPVGVIKDGVIYRLQVESKVAPSTTTTTTSVPASVSSVVLLASNTNRLGATIYNDSSMNILYLKLGTTASLSNYSVQLIPGSYFEVPYGYTGEIDGIWDGTVGNARITELQ